MGIGWANFADFVEAIGDRGLTPASVALLASPVSTGDQTVYTFSGVDLGEEHAQRKVVVPFGARSTTTPRLMDALTVAGIAASLEQNAIGGTSNLLTIGLGVAAVPTGVSGDIVNTLAGASNRLGNGVYRVLGEIISSVISTAAAPTATFNNLPKGSAIIGYVIAADGTVARTFAWTVGADPLTEDFDEVIETTITHSAASVLVPDGGSVTLTATPSAAPSLGLRGVFLAIGPFKVANSLALSNGELLAAFFNNAEWTRTNKLRWAPPRLVNPIEPGVTRDETMPGTGVKAIIPTSFHQWTLDDNQDALVVGATHVTAGTRTAEFHIVGGRNVRVQGYDCYDQRLQVISVEKSIFLEGCRGDFSAKVQPSDALFVSGPPTDPGFANRPDVYVQNCHIKGIHSPADSQFVSGTSGTENKDTITEIVKVGSTVTVTLATGLPGGTPDVDDEVVIDGCDLGGNTDPLTGINYSWRVASAASASSFTLKQRDFSSNGGDGYPLPAGDWTATGGTCWVLPGQGGIHADGLQVSDTSYIRALHVDRFTVEANSRGIIAGANSSQMIVSRYNFKRNDIAPQDINYLNTFAADSCSYLEYYQCYCESRPLFPLEQAVRPDAAQGATGFEVALGHAVEFSGVSAPGPRLGVLYNFAPPGGDFCAYDDVGVGYSSPGYGDLSAGVLLSIEDDIPAEVDSGLAEDGHIAWVDVLPLGLYGDIVDIHISAGDTDRFKLTGRELVRAAVALQAATAYELALTATIRGTATAINKQVTVQTN